MIFNLGKLVSISWHLISLPLQYACQNVCMVLLVPLYSFNTFNILLYVVVIVMVCCEDNDSSSSLLTRVLPSLLSWSLHGLGSIAKSILYLCAFHFNTFISVIKEEPCSKSCKTLLEGKSRKNLFEAPQTRPKHTPKDYREVLVQRGGCQYLILKRFNVCIVMTCHWLQGTVLRGSNANCCENCGCIFPSFKQEPWSLTFCFNLVFCFGFWSFNMYD